MSISEFIILDAQLGSLWTNDSIWAAGAVVFGSSKVDFWDIDWRFGSEKQ